MEKIYNEITDFLDTLLVDEWKGLVKRGMHGNYLLDDEDGLYSFRVPGATRGGFRVNSDGVITEFIVNYDTVINGAVGVYTVNGDELKRLLEERFLGVNINSLSIHK